MFLSDFLWSWLDIYLHSRSSSWTSLIKLRILDLFFTTLMKKSEDSVLKLIRISEDIIFSLRLIIFLKLRSFVFLYDSRLSAVNLIFDQVIICNDSTQIKSSVSESAFFTWQLYCLLILISITVASFLTSIDIKLLICSDIESSCSSFSSAI